MYVHIANTYKSKIKSLLDDILEDTGIPIFFNVCSIRAIVSTTPNWLS